MHQTTRSRLFPHSFLFRLYCLAAIAWLISQQTASTSFPPDRLLPTSFNQLESAMIPASPNIETTTILVDDFRPQPIAGDDFWPINRLGGDRGEIKSQAGNAEMLVWGTSSVTAIINSGSNTAVGLWTSLSHLIQDCTPLNIAAIFPPQIKNEYQGRITAVNIYVLDGAGALEIQLQRGEASQCPPQQTVWASQPITLTGGTQTITLSLPDTLTEVGSLNWVLRGDTGDFVEVDQVTLTAVLPQQLAPAEKAFLWSYAMLLANWHPTTGLTRDRADALAGSFDNISASGMQAATAVVAAHLGFITQTDAQAIVSQTAAGLHSLPTDPCGSNLWPHFAANNQIIPNSEWSSLDTVIAATALLEAQIALGLDSAQTRQFLNNINWNALALADGHISHGYQDNCERIEMNNMGGWQNFGTESWLVNFGHAITTGMPATFSHTPPTYNGSGFIDEMAWLLLPPPCLDRWLFNWCAYSETASATQLAYYFNHPCNNSGQPHFGLSAAEVPDRSVLPVAEIYQAFGVGGVLPANDDAGGQQPGKVVTPHYAGLAAAAQPQAAESLWQMLIAEGIFTPLNNVESYLVPASPACTISSWNALRGSWNLSLQVLGWGRYLAGAEYPLYEAVVSEPSLSAALQNMVANQIFLPVVSK